MVRPDTSSAAIAIMNGRLRGAFARAAMPAASDRPITAQTSGGPICSVSVSSPVCQLQSPARVPSAATPNHTTAPIAASSAAPASFPRQPAGSLPVCGVSLIAVLMLRARP